MFPSPLFATTKLSRPSPVEGTRMAAVGSMPPVEIVCCDCLPATDAGNQRHVVRPGIDGHQVRARASR